MLMTWMDQWATSHEHHRKFTVRSPQGDLAKSGVGTRILFLHPHPLTLQQNDGLSCYACNSKQRKGLVFRCDKCNFNVDVDCAIIRPTIEEKDRQVRTLSIHHHPLVLFINVPKDRIHCCLCGEYCSHPTYACFPCNLSLHRSCYERNLPQEIQHFYHTCPLTLYIYNSGDESYCRGCYESLKPGILYYGCGRCGFGMHVDCTLLPNTDKSSTSSQEPQIQHFLHGHPLSVLSMIKDGDGSVINCYACRKPCTNILTYACFHPSCNKAVYICKTCIELPQEIYHPFHQYHPLTLLQLYPRRQIVDWTATLPGSICNACRKDTNMVVYICQSDHNCNFRLHVGCSEIRAAILLSEGHNHLLHVKEITDGHGPLKCSTCKSTCDSYALSCLDLRCDFNLHLTCGPLPYTIKHKCHIHRLILTNSLATYEDETEDEFYCDACEEDRDPLLPLYQCMECQFAAEVKCVISKVIPSLKGEYGYVELRNPNGQLVRLITKDTTKEMVQEKEKQLEPNLILYNMLRSLSEDEKMELGIVLEAIERETATAKDILSYDLDEVLLFSDKAYTQFMKFLDHDKEIPTFQYQGSFLDLMPAVDQFSYKLDPKEEAVHVGDYVVSKKFAPILKHLLSKHGDISSESLLSPRVKMFLFHMLCGCIYSMKNIKVVDINHDLLLNWSTILKTLQRARFKIQFVVDHLKRISRAHFGLYVREQVDNALNQIDREIAKLEELKVKRKLITSAEYKKSTFIKECLREASILKRWRAGGLLEM